MAGNCQLYFTKPNSYEFIEFNKKKKKNIKDKNNNGSRVPNLSQYTDILNIHGDLVNS